ncbi:NAD-dependent epimerase/dehydratase family protein [Dactylosporangium matsuzakiense]|uniref:UDP-glucose 4-epimerase-like protein n=1 Tax=Dactylosporangium matsuzakiense TaxID=53360 RepID=A0A9W6NTC2_9ACTN|nr:NAD-dependent epimerase/dehydratase family protein [Dactylosporangium matsuzakiense]UWZ48101.1 NAD-dependent epimerase/dehydratase family protein [Dactylosporangium matsuzakiense]GLL08413.1 UDP-glucose 4-epimerase-like protein [Dactylosporangium matsuzakiense]
MRVLVTGGAGFIGSNLCRELTAHPGVSRVVVLDNLSTSTLDNLDGVDVEFAEGSLLDRPLLEDLVAGVDSVVHLGARSSVPRSMAEPVAAHDANVTGTVYLLEACRRRGTHVVAASSSSVYGGNLALPKREDLATRPLSPYAASKLAAEGYVTAYGAAYQLPALAFRFFNVYGPLQALGHAYAAVVPSFMDAALRGEPLRIHGDGRQTRDFTFVGSVVRVLTDAVLRRVTSPTPVNLAFGTRVSVLDLAARVGAALDVPIELEHQPSRPGDARDTQADTARLRELFPDVEAVPMEAGLAATAEWVRARPAYRPLAVA